MIQLAGRDKPSIAGLNLSIYTKTRSKVHSHLLAAQDCLHYHFATSVALPIIFRNSLMEQHFDQALVEAPHSCKVTLQDLGHTQRFPCFSTTPLPPELEQFKVNRKQML